MRDVWLYPSAEAVSRGWGAAFTGEFRCSIGQYGRGEGLPLLDSAIPPVSDDQPHAEGVPPDEGTKRMRDGYLRGALSRPATQRQKDILAAFVTAGGSVWDAAALAKIQPGTVKRHLADLRAAVWPHHRAADLCRTSRRMALRPKPPAMRESRVEGLNDSPPSAAWPRGHSFCEGDVRGRGHHRGAMAIAYVNVRGPHVVRTSEPCGVGPRTLGVGDSVSGGRPSGDRASRSRPCDRSGKVCRGHG